ncbi:hypothetical protein COCSADRAFT_191620 [Bipolaris sorokiniana ND90Pr]|uniref:Uncharacterized protein n=1 Tax=Cochliobolus sativus (strain ND90Pr / ATCC 201652) TaxID=665912 RepID=M2SJ00_COCSN|nr:uncharacterized protein COCSADRAFT_191620 [Bipolaris sorokiniana ND90Pr]EMD62355.1 hypothetical protein COCSADRAFT_191620 [Bipolaris sorokiniana ND90Pr]
MTGGHSPRAPATLHPRGSTPLAFLTASTNNPATATTTATLPPLPIDDDDGEATDRCCCHRLFVSLMVSQGVCLKMKMHQDTTSLLYSPPASLPHQHTKSPPLLAGTPLTPITALHVSTTTSRPRTTCFAHLQTTNDLFSRTRGSLHDTTHSTRSLPLCPSNPPNCPPPQTVDRALASPAQGPSTDTTRENVTRHDANANGLQEHTAFFCCDFFSVGL